MKNVTNGRSQLRRMTYLASFMAIIILLAVTPIGYIPINPVLTVIIIHVPVIVGAVFMGPSAGITLGLTFGITSFLRAPFESAFTALLYGTSIPLTFLVCVAPRVLVGLVAAYAGKLFAKRARGRWARYGLAGLLGSLTNTVFFLGGLYLCFYGAVLEAMPPENSASAGAFLLGIGIANGLPEAAVATALTMALCVPLRRFFENNV